MNRPALLPCRASLQAALRHSAHLTILSFALFASFHIAYADTGRWTPAVDWSGGSFSKYAVHMVLVPGDQEKFHSRILWWRGEGSQGNDGGQWGWNPSDSAGCVALQSRGFTAISLPTSGVDIFCASQVLLGGESRVLIAGGTDPVTGQYGENRARIFAPAFCNSPGTWIAPDSMKDWRWYPGSVALRQGTMVISGNRHPHHRTFGGLRNSASSPSGPQADTLYRFAPVAGGKWDDSVLPAADADTRPEPRYGHSAVDMEGARGLFGQVYFGGRGSQATFNNTWVLHRDDNPLQADYGYRWRRPNISPTFLPDPRSDHSAVVKAGDVYTTEMLVFGGLDGVNNARADVWRLYFDNDPLAQILKWERLFPAGPAPAARYGHVAVYDSIKLVGGQTRCRMIVFGGAAQPSAALLDTVIWELRFDDPSPGSATWYPMTQVDLGPGRPGPRFWPTLSRDAKLRSRSVGGTTKSGHAALMFGGSRGGTSYSDSLWALWVFQDGTAGWELKTFGGTRPSARARHSAVLDPGQGAGGGRLYLYGGETSAADSMRAFVVDPWATSPAWSQWFNAGFRLAGQTALLDGGTVARFPEVFDAASGTFRRLSSSPLSQQFYPPTFLVPGGSANSRVVTLGHANLYWLDVPATGEAGSWHQFANGDPQFSAQTGVMYRPGRIMVAGGTGGSGVVGTTKTFNTDIVANSWMASDSMAARFEHNLVLLPDGKVLAVGGVSSKADFLSSQFAMRWPQIWDPDLGTWTDTLSSLRLAQQPTARTYHSVAVLLPDGRVLSAGGEAPPSGKTGDIFCPPYLFKANGDTAVRPVITSAPACINWGAQYTVTVIDTALIRGACLMRPGATTHAVDQNQRFVPLALSPGSYSTHLVLTAPASSEHAPPGDYLLFLLGSADRSDVPSIAKWVRLGDNSGQGAPCELVAPGMIEDLNPDLVSQTTVYLTWSATADDGIDPATGVEREFHLRRSPQQINTEIRWLNAIEQLCEPMPGPYGTAAAHNVTPLQPCTNYEFAVRADDDERNLSPLHPRINVSTLCIGGGGGGFSARLEDESREEAGPVANEPGNVRSPVAPSAKAASIRTAPTTGSTASPPGAASAALKPARGALIVETGRTAAGGWRITVKATALAEGLEPGEPDGAVVQQRDPSGPWHTRARHQALDDDVVGLSALRDRGRVVLLGDHGIEQVAAAFSSGSATFALASAVHSRLGNLGAEFAAMGGSVDVLLGDGLELRYEMASPLLSTAPSWYLTAGRGRLASAARGIPAPSEGRGPPLRFALHQNHPNPFNTATTIRFDLPVGAMVRLDVFDLLGRRVRALSNHFYPPGYQSVEWDRRDGSGNRVAPGVYMYRLQAGAFLDRSKMVLLP